MRNNWFYEFIIWVKSVWFYLRKRGVFLKKEVRDLFKSNGGWRGKRGNGFIRRNSTCLVDNER